MELDKKEKELLGRAIDYTIKELDLEYERIDLTNEMEKELTAEIKALQSFKSKYLL